MTGEVSAKEEMLRQLNYELAMINCDFNSGLENKKIDYMVFEKMRALKEEEDAKDLKTQEKKRSKLNHPQSPVDKFKVALKTRVENM